MQSQTQQRRIELANRLGGEVIGLIETHRLPERTFDAIYDATVGLKVRRQRYVESAQIDERTGTRDLLELSRLDLLKPQGQARGRFYLAGDAVVACSTRARQDLPRMRDPYPGFIEELRRQARDLQTSDDTGAAPRLRTRSLQARS